MLVISTIIHEEILIIHLRRMSAYYLENLSIQVYFMLILSIYANYSIHILKCI